MQRDNSDANVDEAGERNIDHGNVGDIAIDVRGVEISINGCFILFGLQRE